MANFTALERAPWEFSYGEGDPDLMPECKHTYDNGFTRRYRNQAGTAVIDLFSVDATNNILHGAAVYKPMRDQETFFLAPTAQQGTIPFWISDGYYYITAISETHATAGSDAAAVTAQVIVDHGAAVAPGAGLASNGTGGPAMSSTFNLKATANTVQNATLADVLKRSTMAIAKSNPPIGLVSPIVIRPGDRLTFKTTGVLTALAGVMVSIAFAPFGVTNSFSYFQNLNARIVTSPFAIVSRPGLVVTGISASWSAVSSAAGTLKVTVDSDGTAAGGGTTLQTGTIDLTAAANTTVNGVLTATVANLTLPAGARLSVVITGATGVAGLAVTVYTTSSTRQEVSWYQQSNTDLGVNQGMAGPFDRDYLLTDVFCSFETAAGGALKLAVTADAPGVAPGAGVVVQTDNTNAGFDLNGTPATVQVGTLAAQRLRILPAGWRLGLKYSTTKQAVAGVVVGATLVAY